jgi:hypothetical protein
VCCVCCVCCVIFSDDEGMYAESQMVSYERAGHMPRPKPSPVPQNLGGMLPPPPSPRLSVAPESVKVFQMSGIAGGDKPVLTQQIEKLDGRLSRSDVDWDPDVTHVRGPAGLCPVLSCRSATASGAYTAARGRSSSAGL